NLHVHTGLRRLCRRERTRSPAPTTMIAHPAAAVVPLVPGAVPPPVAAAPTGALMVAFGVGDVTVPVGVLVAVAVLSGALVVAFGVPAVTVPVGVVVAVAVLS